MQQQQKQEEQVSGKLLELLVWTLLQLFLQIYAPVAHLQQKLQQRQLLQQQRNPEAEQYGFGVQFRQHQTQFFGGHQQQQQATLQQQQLLQEHQDAILVAGDPILAQPASSPPPPAPSDGRSSSFRSHQPHDQVRSNRIR